MRVASIAVVITMAPPASGSQKKDSFQLGPIAEHNNNNNNNSTNRGLSADFTAAGLGKCSTDDAFSPSSRSDSF